MIEFTVTEEHLKLLRRMNVNWDCGEFGAPAIDCKRPYGNSCVLQDIAEILEIEYSRDNRDWDLEDRLNNLHKETETCLEILLSNLSIKEGTYTRKDKYITSWKLQNDPTK